MHVNINIPKPVNDILKRLNNNGHEAFVVGGCVRDSFLGRIPEDWDITTSAFPEQVKKIFDKTYDTGIKHGTVTVLIDHLPYEVTTYRIDGGYEDCRHPTEVLFTSNIVEDLKRRDFTMNAIAYHPDKGFIDPYHGIEDIKHKIIRCVGKPEERFQEDALRMLRAVRFAAQLDFIIEKSTFEAIKTNGRLISKVSSERIREELNKLLLSNHPEKLLLLTETGIMDMILPEFQQCMLTEQHYPYHIYNVGEHIIETVKNIEPDFILRWTMLLHDMGKALTRTTDEKGMDHFYDHTVKSEEIAYNILRRLKFDNRSMNKIIRLIKWHDHPIEPTKKAVKRAVRVIGEDIIEDLFKVKEADMRAQNPEFLQERLIQLEHVKEIYEHIKHSQECFSMKDLAVNGSDLIDIGFKEGKQIGRVLEKLLDYVIDRPEANQKEHLLEYAKRYLD